MRALAVVLLLIPLAAGAYTPRVNYQLQCMGCHRPDGSGETGRVPDLRGTLVAFSGTADGRDYVLRVPGVAQAPLTDAEVAAVLNWMAAALALAPSVDFRPYTASEVAAARHRPLPAVQARRADLLARLAP